MELILLAVAIKTTKTMKKWKTIMWHMHIKRSWSIQTLNQTDDKTKDTCLVKSTRSIHQQQFSLNPPIGSCW